MGLGGDIIPPNEFEHIISKRISLPDFSPVIFDPMVVEGINDSPCAIRRAVVHNNELKIAVSLIQDALYRLTDISFPLINRHQYSY